ncbi:MAG: ABC transporter permease, partial [Gammaproteobacteria bacterium]|nr:ABC transporter permease [Gammaproteobacteria bacterium]
MLLVLLWQWLAASSSGIRSVISSPLDVARALAVGIGDGTVATDIGASLERALLGWLITVAVATPLAIAAGRVREARANLD